MNGIEILASNEIVVAQTFNWSNFWFAFGFIFVLATLIGIWAGCSGHDWRLGAGIFIFLLILGTLVCAGIAGSTGIPTKYETHYKVTIDDSVSMNEFLDKYEILDQEGKIYTVKEK